MVYLIMSFSLAILYVHTGANMVMTKTTIGAFDTDVSTKKKSGYTISD